MKRKTALLLAVLMLFTAALPQSIQGASRISRSLVAAASVGYPAERTILYSYDRGYLDYLPQGFDFTPITPVTNAQFAASIDMWLERNSDLVKEYGFRYNPTSVVLSDVSPEHYYYRQITSVVKKGLMKGDDRDNFRPNSPITNEEAAFTWYNLLAGLKTSDVNLPTDKEVDEILSSFADAKNIGVKYRRAVAAVAKLKLMQGYDDNNFYPKQTMDFGDMCQMLASVDGNLPGNVNNTDRTNELIWADSRTALPAPTQNITSTASPVPTIKPTAIPVPNNRFNMRLTALEASNPNDSYEHFFTKLTMEYDTYNADSYITVAYSETFSTDPRLKIDDKSLFPHSNTFQTNSLEVESEDIGKRILTQGLESEISGATVYVYAMMHSEGIRGDVLRTSVTLLPKPTPLPEPPTPSPIPTPTADPNAPVTPTPSPSPTPLPSETVTPSPSPEPEAQKIIDVSASSRNHFSLAIAEDDDGTTRLYGWGFNNHGQLPTSNATSIPTPVKIPISANNVELEDYKVEEVYAGNIIDKPVTFVIVQNNATNKRELYYFGGQRNSSDSSRTDTALPTLLPTPNGISQFYYNGNSAFYIDDNGVLRECRISEANLMSALSFAEVTDENSNPLPKIKMFSQTEDNYAAVDENNALYHWTAGANVKPKIVDDPATTVLVQNDFWKTIVTARDTLLALSDGGDLFGLGAFVYNNVNNVDTRQNTLVRVSEVGEDASGNRTLTQMTGISSIAAGQGDKPAFYAVGTRKDDNQQDSQQLWVWGNNNFAQLAEEPTQGTQNYPKNITSAVTGFNVADLASVSPSNSYASAYALVGSPGESNPNVYDLYVWGWNKYGQLGIGDGQPPQYKLPQLSMKDIKVKKVFSIGASTYIITADDKLYVCGNVFYGIMNNSMSESYIFTPKKVIVPKESTTP